MFSERVVRHYRERGYRVQQEVRLRGGSGRVHAADLVAQGPLGNLIVTIRDRGGGTELATLRAKSKDLGVTAVLAVPSAEPDVRRAAARMGIAVLEEDMLVTEELPESSVAPWPEPKRSVAQVSPSMGLWESEPEPPQTVVQAEGGWLVALSEGRLPEEAPVPLPDEGPGIDMIQEFIELDDEVEEMPILAPAPPGEVRAPLRTSTLDHDGDRRRARSRLPPAPALREDRVATGETSPRRPEPSFELRGHTEEEEPLEVQHPYGRPPGRPEAPVALLSRTQIAQAALGGIVAGGMLFVLGFLLL